MNDKVRYLPVVNQDRTRKGVENELRNVVHIPRRTLEEVRDCHANIAGDERRTLRPKHQRSLSNASLPCITVFSAAGLGGDRRALEPKLEEEHHSE